MIKSILANKTALLAYLIVSISLLIICLASPFWPDWQWLIPIKYALLFGPRWLLYVLLLPALLAFFQRQTLHKGLALSLFLLTLGFNGLSVSAPQPLSAEQGDIVIMSANLGGSVNVDRIPELFEKYDIDVAVFQEAAKFNGKDLLPNIYQDCAGSLCLFSRFPFTSIEHFGRKTFGGWGNFANQYEIAIGHKTITLFNIHLETPRPVIQSLLGLSIDIEEAQQVDDNRRLEASIIASAAQQSENVVLLGDFNMPIDENIYQQYFSSYSNALRDTNYWLQPTKRTKWHSVTIDHLLHSPQLESIEAFSVDELHGDHNQLIVTIAFAQSD
ncbi:endonuclease/exonuclease/phosphatase family protein [Thalassotalea agarivorans]|uniref:Endonuclease/Exonuclease/phosphatase family protein n=1 Tax=Thalassotalea agarivorans TaxID=349064 RepID=A0A1I0DVJ8_THASX|nr:endonuclease/exonuclease/phosphatase family protein [Thalassotalea agarivorans]SET36550.1 Endonuclease/Exonuclease/phosphatase family protein [Thalassotalea agarivorans]